VQTSRRELPAVCLAVTSAVFSQNADSVSPDHRFISGVIFCYLTGKTVAQVLPMGIMQTKMHQKPMFDDAENSTVLASACSKKLIFACCTELCTYTTSKDF